MTNLKLTVDDQTYWWASVVEYMSNEIREEIHNDHSRCIPRSPAEFWERYCDLDPNAGQILTVANKVSERETTND